MPIGTAFHPRTSALCESMSWRDWAGYFAVSTYEVHHEREYNAIRNAAALIDISPLFKYRVSGRDATRLVDRVITRDAGKIAVGQAGGVAAGDPVLEEGRDVDEGRRVADRVVLAVVLDLVAARREVAGPVPPHHALAGGGRAGMKRGADGHGQR